MGKSIEDILKQIELERSQRINEEQSKLDEINQQRDLARKEWNKRLSMYESISNESTSPAAGAGGGSINEVIEYLTWIYISGDDLEYKVMSFSPSSIEIESQNLNNKTVDVTYTPIDNSFFGGATQNLGEMTFANGFISIFDSNFIDVLQGTYSLYSADYDYTYSIRVLDTGVYNETIVPARLDYINEKPFEGVRIGTFGTIDNYLNGKTVSVLFHPVDETPGDPAINIGTKIVPFTYVTSSPYGIYTITYGTEVYTLNIPLPIPDVDFKVVQLFDSIGGTQSVIFDNISYGYQPAVTAWSISGTQKSNSPTASGDWSLVSFEAQRPSLIVGNSIGSLPPVYGGTTNLEVAFVNGDSYDVTLYVKNSSGVSSKTKTIDVTSATPGVITGITYSLRYDNFTWIVDLVWNVNPLSVYPNINYTSITAINGSSTDIPISSITIYNSGTPYKSGAGVYFLKTGPTLTGNDTITISVLTTTGQYAVGSIGPLDFRSS